MTGVFYPQVLGEIPFPGISVWGMPYSYSPYLEGNHVHRLDTLRYIASQRNRATRRVTMVYLYLQRISYV